MLTFSTIIGSALFVDGTPLLNSELGELELDGCVAEIRAAGRLRENKSGYGESTVNIAGTAACGTVERHCANRLGCHVYNRLTVSFLNTSDTNKSRVNSCLREGGQSQWAVLHATSESQRPVFCTIWRILNMFRWLLGKSCSLCKIVYGDSCSAVKVGAASTH